MMPKKFKIILLLIGIFYLGYILIFLSKFDFNPSATILLSEKLIEELLITPNGRQVIHTEINGYDGVYYYLLSNDIFLENIMVDGPARLQRILYPFFTYIISFGNQYMIPYMMILINFLSIILGTYFLLLLLKKYNANLSLAYLWALNIGFMISISRDLRLLVMEVPL